MMGRGAGERRSHEAGFTLTEIVVALGIATILIGMLAPMVYKFVQKDRAATTVAQLQALYTGIVGDPKQGTYGYLGDVGDYPASLLDLIQLPASNPPGWNGPYVTNISVNSQGQVIDAFGGSIEYYNLIQSGGSDDILVLISKGPDLSSTNTASNPNMKANFTGTLPSDPTYGSQAANGDNVVFPNFVSTPGLLTRPADGTLTYSIFNFDANPSVNAIVPACPTLYTITVTSVPRGSNDVVSLAYQPGVISDLVQGLYDVRITSLIATTPVWQERVSIPSGGIVAKTLNLIGLDSSATPMYSLTINNQSGINLDVYSGTTLLKTVNSGSTSTVNINACSQTTVKNHSTHFLYDEFVMPFSNVTKLYTSANLYSLCVTNSGTTDSKVLVYDQGLLLGTVEKHGKKKVRCFGNIQAGETITIMDKKGNLIQSFTMPSSNYNVTI